MNSSNTWLDGSEEPGKAKKIVEFLEERAQFPDQMQVNNALIHVLSPKKGEHILEVGSGSGILSRLVASHLASGGHVTGIDISPEIINLSREYAQKENLDNMITFEVGDAKNVKYPDGIFDAAFAARLLLYLEDPEDIVIELNRVVKPGGRIVLMEWDFETLVVDHSDRELTRRILHWRNDNIDGNNWSGREIYRLMNMGGLDEVSIFPVVTTTTEEKSSLTQSLWHAAANALEQDIITKEEHGSWVEEIESKIKNQQYFAGIVYFIGRGIVR